MTAKNDYDDVGYRKPPKHTQFIKGRSGNPKGRPKHSRNLTTILERVGKQQITVKLNGRSRSISRLEASIMQLWNKAVSGDLSAIRLILGLANLVENAPDPLNELLTAMREESNRLDPKNKMNASLPDGGGDREKD